jgi:hypothetical protein
MYMSFLDQSMTYSCGIHAVEQGGDLQVRLCLVEHIGLHYSLGIGEACRQEAVAINTLQQNAIATWRSAVMPMCRAQPCLVCSQERNVQQPLAAARSSYTCASILSTLKLSAQCASVQSSDAVLVAYTLPVFERYECFHHPVLCADFAVCMPSCVHPPAQAAQMAKLDAVIAAADIQATDHVLEIGCGWGSFAMRAAFTTGCR